MAEVEPAPEREKMHLSALASGDENSIVAAQHRRNKFPIWRA
jgi:hypothetical protein